MIRFLIKIALLILDNTLQVNFSKIMNEEKELKFNYDIKNNINFLTNIKKPVGTLTIEYQNKEIYIDKLYLNERVNFSILTYIIYHYKVITSLLIIILILKRKKKI